MGDHCLACEFVHFRDIFVVGTINDFVDILGTVGHRFDDRLLALGAMFD